MKNRKNIISGVCVLFMAAILCWISDVNVIMVSAAESSFSSEQSAGGNDYYSVQNENNIVIEGETGWQLYADTPSISLDRKTVVMNEKSGNTVKLKVTVRGSSNKVSWKSSDSKIASVSKTGVITAGKAGKATITATANGKKAVCKVTVVHPTIKLNKKSAVVYTGKTLQLKATITGASKKTVWKSSDKNIASVNSNGKVTAGKKAGTVTISAKANGVTAKCKVTIGLSKSQQLAIMKKKCGRTVEKSVYVDMDCNGLKELLGTYSVAGVHHVWYCSSDGKKCLEVHVDKLAMDECSFEILRVNGKKHVAFNSYNLMGTVKRCSVLVLEQAKVRVPVSNQYGYIAQDSSGDILLNVEAYDSMYDPSIGSFIGHTWKDTYLFYDGKEYKEYGATKISKSEFLKYENAQTILNKIKSENKGENIKLSYYRRKNGIIHIQCNGYDSSGSVDYSYYTVKYKNNAITVSSCSRNSGIMETYFSGLKVVY